MAEAAEHLPERLDMVGVGGDAGHDVGVARLHRARGAAQRHHARGAAGRNVVEPARTEAQMLGDADGGVGPEREAADREAVDPVLGDARALDQRVHRLADEPMRAVRRVAPVGHGHRNGDGDAFVRSARHVRSCCRPAATGRRAGPASQRAGGPEAARARCRRERPHRGARPWPRGLPDRPGRPESVRPVGPPRRPAPVKAPAPVSRPAP